MSSPVFTGERYSLLSTLCLTPAADRPGLIHMGQAISTIMQHYTSAGRRAYIDISDVRPGDENVFLNIIVRQHAKAVKLMEGAASPASTADPFRVLTTLTHGRS